MTAALLAAPLVDDALPALPAALDCASATQAFRAASSGALRGVTVTGARLVRHKPGRRAVIEYDLAWQERDGAPRTVTAIGKMRARRYPGHAHRLIAHLWHHGFDDGSPDGIRVPEPLGIVRPLCLWLQRKAPGEMATGALATPDGPAIARRIVEAAAKLHRTPGLTRRSHTADDELAVLVRVCDAVAATRPAWRGRLAALLEGCRRLAHEVRALPAVPIHRDFYGDQVLVDGAGLTLIDFDLYCDGPAALDAGNFLGHVREHAVRAPQLAAPLAATAAALLDASEAHAGPEGRRAVQVFGALTLARHVYLCHVVPGRLDHAPAMLAAAEAAVEATLDVR